MAEFINNVDNSIIFENKTDSEFSVNAGIVFRKSGLYEVSVCDNRTTVTKVGALSIQSIQPKWISVSERLPEENVDVLICYRYKTGKGDRSNTYIAIASYGRTYFGRITCNSMEWRAPFEFFHANYEVVAWMPLPEPYKEDEDEQSC